MKLFLLSVLYIHVLFFLINVFATEPNVLVHDPSLETEWQSQDQAKYDVRFQSNLYFGPLPTGSSNDYMFKVVIEVIDRNTGVVVPGHIVRFKLPTFRDGVKYHHRLCSAYNSELFINIYGLNYYIPQEICGAENGFYLRTSLMGAITLTVSIPEAFGQNFKSPMKFQKERLFSGFTGFSIKLSPNSEWKYHSLTKSTLVKIVDFFKRSGNFLKLNKRLSPQSAKDASGKTSKLASILLDETNNFALHETKRLKKRDFVNSTTGYVDHYTHEAAEYATRRTDSLAVFVNERLDRIQVILLNFLDSIDVGLPKVFEKIALYFSWSEIRRTSRFFKHYFTSMESLISNTSSLWTSSVEQDIISVVGNMQESISQMKQRILPDTGDSTRFKDAQIAVKRDARVTEIQELTLGAFKKMAEQLDNETDIDTEFSALAQKFAREARELAQSRDTKVALKNASLVVADTTDFRFPGKKTAIKAYSKVVSALFDGLGSLVTVLGSITAKGVGLGLQIIPAFVAKFYKLLTMPMQLPDSFNFLRRVLGLDANAPVALLDILSLMVGAPVYYLYVSYMSEAPFSEAEISALDTVSSPLEYARVFYALPDNTKTMVELKQRHDWLLRMAWVALTWADVFTFRAASPPLHGLVVAQTMRWIAPANGFLLGTLFFPTPQADRALSAVEYAPLVLQLYSIWYYWYLSWMTFTAWKFVTPMVDFPILYIAPHLPGKWQLNSASIAKYISEVTLVNAVLGGIPETFWAIVAHYKIYGNQNVYMSTKAMKSISTCSVNAWLLEGLGYLLMVFPAVTLPIQSVAAAFYTHRLHKMIKERIYDIDI